MAVLTMSQWYNIVRGLNDVSTDVWCCSGSQSAATSLLSEVVTNELFSWILTEDIRWQTSCLQLGVATVRTKLCGTVQLRSGVANGTTKRVVVRFRSIWPIGVSALFFLKLRLDSEKHCPMRTWFRVRVDVSGSVLPRLELVVPNRFEPRLGGNRDSTVKREFLSTAVGFGFYL